METTKIAIFRGKQIRKTIHKDEWWFSVVDVCEALTESPDAGAYWRKLKQRLREEGSEVVTFCHGLKLEAPDGYIKDMCRRDPELGKGWGTICTPLVVETDGGIYGQ